MRKFTFLVFIILIISTVFGYKFYSDSIHYSKDQYSDSRVVVEIKKGSTATSVGNLLLEKKLIKDARVFKFYLNQNDLTDQIKAGRIVVQENFTLPEIINALIEGKSQEVPVTLLEGWTVKQIASYLEDSGLTTAKDFIKCSDDCEFAFDFLPNDYLEGYLYPDTYFVNSATFDDKVFIGRLINTLNNKLTRADWNAIDNSDHSLEEIMIMASIVEREERNSKERATVAGILWNRFDANMGLGADATTLYALGRTKGGLTYEDLQIDSPFNTRKYKGLPPTPICNPSISSIRAALYPKKTDYWYYLHGSDGVIHYAKTNDGHNENKRKYL